MSWFCEYAENSIQLLGYVLKYSQAWMNTSSKDQSQLANKAHSAVYLSQEIFGNVAVAIHVASSVAAFDVWQ